MALVRRIVVSFVVIFDILGFGIVFVIMSNTSPAQDPDLIYMAEGDAVFASVVGLVGIAANLALALILVRGSLRAHRHEGERKGETRGRISGE